MGHCNVTVIKKKRSNFLQNTNTKKLKYFIYILRFVQRNLSTLLRLNRICAPYVSGDVLGQVIVRVKGNNYRQVIGTFSVLTH